jgi:lysozyme
MHCCNFSIVVWVGALGSAAIGGIIMRFRFLAAAFVFANIVGSASAQEGTPLTGDPSQAQLFARMVRRMDAESRQTGGQPVALSHNFAFPEDAIWDTSIRPKELRKNSIFGIDVSHYDEDDCAPKCKIDWEKVQGQNVIFVYMKASQGQGYDGRFYEYLGQIANAKLSAAQPLYIGAYHFLSSTAPKGVAPSDWGKAQAKYFLAIIKNRLPAHALPPVLDLEADVHKDSGDYDFWLNVKNDKSRGPDFIIQQALDWLTSVQASTGQRPILYTSKTWWDDIIGDEKKFARFRDFGLWAAGVPKGSLQREMPRVPNGAPWTMWQFTDSSTLQLHAIPGTADANIFKGTTAEFHAAMGLP